MLARFPLLGSAILGLCLAVFLQKLKNTSRYSLFSRPTIILFGDSLTQLGFDVENAGWVAQLENWFTRKADILNRGFSGYNTRFAVTMLERLFPVQALRESPPLFVTIFFGANDAAIEGFSQHVPIAEYRENLSKILTYFTKINPSIPIIVITPPPVYEKKWGEECEQRGYTTRGVSNRLNSVTMKYVSSCKEVAESQGCHVIDLWERLGGLSEETIAPHLSDGLHLSSSGNTILFQCLQTLILEKLPHLNPEKLKMQGQYWGDINPTHPQIDL